MFNIFLYIYLFVAQRWWNFFLLVTHMTVTTVTSKRDMTARAPKYSSHIWRLFTLSSYVSFMTTFSWLSSFDFSQMILHDQAILRQTIENKIKTQGISTAYFRSYIRLEIAWISLRLSTTNTKVYSKNYGNDKTFSNLLSWNKDNSEIEIMIDDL